MTTIAGHALVWMPVAIAAAVLMDLWAALLHRVAWHGPLWNVHRSHHSPRIGRLERNDALGVLHAPIAVALILDGCVGRPGALREVAFGAGIGMTAFGMAYLVVHDGLVHGRLPLRFLFRLSLLRSIARAHARHHATPLGGPPYGLFSGHWELRWLTERERGPSAPLPMAPRPEERDATPRDDESRSCEGT